MRSRQLARTGLAALLFGLLFYAGTQHWDWAQEFTGQFQQRLADPDPPFLLQAPYWVLRKLPVVADQVAHYLYVLWFGPLMAAVLALWQGFGWRQFLAWAVGLVVFFVVVSLGLVMAVDLLLPAKHQRIAWDFASAFFTPVPLFLLVIYFWLQKLFKPQ
jgi:hypothetical protein